jgi:hypothetical protein
VSAFFFHRQFKAHISFLGNADDGNGLLMKGEGVEEENGCEQQESDKKKEECFFIKIGRVKIDFLTTPLTPP